MGNEWKKEKFVLSTDKERLQLVKIHHFLSTQAYWCLGIPFDVVKNAIEGSLCFGLYTLEDGTENQIGFARVVTDNATFAWLCDIYVEPSFRNRGLSKWMMGCLMTHPNLKNLRRLCLATKDAHSLYKQFGFEVTATPQNWMEIKDNDLYRKMQIGFKK